jgi:Domain of unknown function (DUF4276)
MAKYVIVPIVEGRGELDAVPILLRGWLKFRRYRNVEVHSEGPVYAGGKGNLTAAHDSVLGRGVEHFTRLAWLRRPDVILILLDADEECPAMLAAALLARARTRVPHDCPIGVVVAHREYEAWFLAAFAPATFRRALEDRGYRLRQRSLPRGLDVEAVADCKGRIETLIHLKYRPAIHQPALTRILPFKRWMARRSRSFRKLLEELDELLIKARRRRSLAERGMSRGGAKAPKGPL